MNYEAIIFDLDGVLCHTDRYHYRAWSKMASELGLVFDETINDRLRGVGRMKSLEIILQANHRSLSTEEKEYYAKEKNNIYRAMLDSMTPDDIDPDVIKTLTALCNLPVKLAVGSSSKNAKTILEKTALARYFDAVYDGTNVTHPKPHPEVFQKASEFLGTKPKRCLVVEDAKAGVEAARRAHMDCAAIGDAKDHKQATYRLNRLSDLLDLL